jgi:hypothetical protein
VASVERCAPRDRVRGSEQMTCCGRHALRKLSEGAKKDRKECSQFSDIESAHTGGEMDVQSFDA